MEHPFAITLDVGTSLINHTGSWRTLKPEYVHRLPPAIMPVRPARISRAGSLTPKPATTKRPGVP